MSKYAKALRLLAQNSGLLDLCKNEISMPNIPFPTLGGEVMWNTLASEGGWRLQQNMLTQHARILNSDDIRVAWGSLSAMDKLISRIINAAE